MGSLEVQLSIICSFNIVVTLVECLLNCASSKFCFVQFAASIWRGGKTPTGANVHGAKQLKTDVDLLQLFAQNLLDGSNFWKKNFRL